MTDKPTTPPAGESALKFAVGAATSDYRAEIATLRAALSEAQSKLTGAWSEPYRVACDKHNEFRPVFTEGRPLLDDRCPWCLLEQEKDAFEGQARLTAEAQSKLTAVQAELEAERGKEAPVDVFYKRMAESGHSYDAKAGIWWSDDSKPGVLADLEAKLVATETQKAEIWDSFLKQGLEFAHWVRRAWEQDDKLNKAVSRVARCHRLLRDIQWRGWLSFLGGSPACPSCQKRESTKIHANDCPLQAELTAPVVPE